MRCIEFIEMGCLRLEYYEDFEPKRNNFLEELTFVETSIFSRSAYFFGFQGQEKDDEIKGAGNSVNYTYRMHDPRLGRFFAVDPLSDLYSWNSPYAFSENNVIHAIELEGLEKRLIFHGVKQKSDDNFIKNVANACARVLKSKAIAAPTGKQFLSEIEANTTIVDRLSVLIFWGHSWNRGLYLENDKGFYRGGSTTGNPDARNTNDLGISIASGQVQVSDHTLVIFASCGAAGDGTGGHGAGEGVLDETNSLAANFAKAIGENYVLESHEDFKVIKITVIGGDDLSNLYFGDKAVIPDGSFHKLEYQYTIERDSAGNISRTMTAFKATNLGKTINPGKIANSHDDCDTEITP